MQRHLPNKPEDFLPVSFQEGEGLGIIVLELSEVFTVPVNPLIAPVPEEADPETVGLVLSLPYTGLRLFLPSSRVESSLWQESWDQELYL